MRRNSRCVRLSTACSMLETTLNHRCSISALPTTCKHQCGPHLLQTNKQKMYEPCVWQVLPHLLSCGPMSHFNLQASSKVDALMSGIFFSASHTTVSCIEAKRQNWVSRIVKKLTLWTVLGSTEHSMLAMHL